MPEPVSDEVRQMQDKERRRWLTVAEAQRLRASWSQMRASVDDLAEKFDADPDDESGAQLFVVISALTVSGFGSQAHAAVEKLNELMPKKGGDDA